MILKSSIKTLQRSYFAEHTYELYKMYLIVGGMPKYPTPSETIKIKDAYNSIPAQLGKDIKSLGY